MRVIGVIDLKSGQVVRGVAGRRDEYRPIESRLCAGSAPCEVAAALADVNVAKIYVADLDAIAGAAPDWHAYDAIARAGLPMLIDAGIASLNAATDFLAATKNRLPLAGLIIGLETLSSLSVLDDILAAIGPERLIFSLDIIQHRPNTTIAKFSAYSPLELAQAVLRIGVRRMVVLDIASVGMGGGVSTVMLCERIRLFAIKGGMEVELVGGGGVRNLADIAALAKAGCDAVLVASALHDLRVTAADLAALR